MSRTGVLLFVVLIALFAFAIFAWPRFEGTAPKIESPDAVVVGATGAAFEIVLRDADSGLRSLQLRLRHSGGTETLIEQGYDGGLMAGGATTERRIEVVINPEELGLRDGEASLAATVRDWSWRDGGDGNRSELSMSVLIDTTPPKISSVSGITYVYRGGAATAIYEVSEVVARDGIRVGDTFFQGHPLPGTSEEAGRRIVFFAVPVDAARNPAVFLEAEDAAGNVATARPPVRVFERKFPEEPINLSASFFENVVPDLAKAVGVEAPDNLSAFQIINRDTRAQNEKRIRELIREVSPTPLWEGAFTQLANSKVMSRFAEQRRYYSDSREISQATHFGFDLASRVQAPITAANSGRVMFAGDLGIYGNCVLVDHGMGLVSLYAHLSAIDATVGETVEKNEVLGRSGATGLAGGDHLHFAILVGGTYVDPLEWWDARWVKSHVAVRLASSKP